MKQAVLVGISALLMAVFMPVWLLVPVEGSTAGEVFLIIEAGEQEPEQESEPAQMILVKTEGTIQELPLEEYLVGVVLSEMPASFELEALKAQAVAARTFTLRQTAGGKHEDCDVCADSSCCQAWSSREAMEEKLGAAIDQYWSRAETAVQQTAGQVLTYDGTLIDAVYFSCSGGETEAAVAVWGTDIPYLQSVPSEGEEDAVRYQSQTSVSLAQFQAILSEACPSVELVGNPASWFGEVSNTEGGGVATMEIGGCSFTGTQLRSMFGLNSAKFYIEVSGQEIVFHVSGFGHRVGMSQYGANAMAKQGSTYDEILLHYYSGVELEIKNP